MPRHTHREHGQQVVGAGHGGAKLRARDFGAGANSPDPLARQAAALLGDVVDGRGEVVDILRRDADHADAPVLGEVDGVLLLQLLDLRGVAEPRQPMPRAPARATVRRSRTCQSGSSRGSNPSRSLRAVMACLQPAGQTLLLEQASERRAHGDDAVRHDLHLLFPAGRCSAQWVSITAPLGGEGRVGHDGGGQARAVDGRVRVHRAAHRHTVSGTCGAAPDDDLELRVHRLDLGIAAAHDGEGAHALACTVSGAGWEAVAHRTGPCSWSTTG